MIVMEDRCDKSGSKEQDKSIPGLELPCMLNPSPILDSSITTTTLAWFSSITIIGMVSFSL
jgi:hypothetical protein